MSTKHMSLEAVLEDYTRMSGTKSAAAVTRDNPDGSDHPAAKPPENVTVNPEQGERGKENDTDVESNITGSVNDPAPPDTAQEGSDAVEFLNAPTTQTGEDKQTFKTTVQDPGTESLADVSVEKTAEAIEKALKQHGRTRVVGALSKEALDFLSGAVKADASGAPGKVNPADTAKTAAAGAAQAKDEIQVDPEFAEFMKNAAIEAVNDAIVAGVALGEYWQSKQAEAEGEPPPEDEAPPENAEPSPEELAGVGAASEELPPEALAELMQMVGGGGMGDPGMGDPGMGEPGLDGINPEVAAILSEILDQAGLTPEDAMGIEANATALDPEGAPEAKMAYLKQAARSLRAVTLFREKDPLKDFQKRAATVRRDRVHRGVQEYIAKAAYIVQRRRENAAVKQ